MTRRSARHLACELAGIPPVGGRMSISGELVSDPVSHISISGVHGRKALEERIANAETQSLGGSGSAMTPLVAGALLGVALMFLLNRRAS